MAKFSDLFRGDIVIAEFATNRGFVKHGTRPCIIMSNDIHNSWQDVLTVAPLTDERSYRSNVPTQTLLTVEETGLEKNSSADLQHMQAIDRRFINPRAIAKLGDRPMARVQACIINLLGLESMLDPFEQDSMEELAKAYEARDANAN